MKHGFDITGMKSGRLTALHKDGHDKYGHPLWLCECECGDTARVLTASILHNKTKSCGCYYADTRHEVAKTHGSTYTRLYKIWAGIHRRCDNPNSKDWKYYGGKGVSVCDEWKDYRNFEKWAIESGYSDALSIDRIDSNHDYCPENCRWADKYQQMNNTSKNHFITINGETHTIAEWSRIRGISLSTIFYRLKAGWDEDLAIIAPKHSIKRGTV